ncbi:MAG: Gfo/Idh/MocA family oxidoreductase [Chloroflexi bacterium]|nr:Gfo/Idh/MocA family oxidoreductase [Chloroflexota bacterium]
MLRVGIVGVGGRAQVHLRALDAINRTTVVGIVDALSERAERAAAERGATAYPSVGEMLVGAHPDVVYVVVPYHVSAAVAVPVLEAKVPLFTEKTLALTPADARTIAAAAERASVPTAVGYQWRYSDTVERLHEAVPEERVGLTTGHYYSGKPQTQWGLQRRFYGGQVFAQLTHVLDISRYVAGEVQSVQAAYGQRIWPQREREPGFDVWDVSAVICRYTSGAVGSLHCTYGLGGKVNSIELRVVARDELWTWTPSALQCRHTDGRVETWESAVDPVRRMHEAFLDAVATSRPDLVRSPISDALQSALVCAAANQSADTRGGIPLSDV